MLFNERMLQKYLTFLMKECDSEIYTFKGDFCMKILYYLLIGILNFSKGQNPKPTINNNMKVYVLEKTELFLNRWIDL